MGVRYLTTRIFWVAAGTSMFLTTTAAHADLVLSEVIVDLTPGKPPREDIEAWNNGAERIYVVALPAEIINPGQPTERRVDVADPTQGGLLVTPQRMILEPGERRLIRIASLAARSDHDRIYRVEIKPVVGDVKAATSAIKVLVGYDVLVILRPDKPTIALEGKRKERTLRITNTGDTNVEIYNGRQCDDQKKNCFYLLSRRIYAGQSFSQQINNDNKITYSAKMDNKVIQVNF